jgi:hypothetical protein
MLFMVIERYRNGDAAPVYERFHARGRMLPDGLNYIDSWVTEDGATCYQLMESDDATLFAEWISCWSDLVDFEVVPVMTSAQAAESSRSRTATGIG